MTKNVVSKKIFVQLDSDCCLLLPLVFFRIINADTQCGRISNPTERGASYKIKYRFFIIYKNNCTT